MLDTKVSTIKAILKEKNDILGPKKNLSISNLYIKTYQGY